VLLAVSEEAKTDIVVFMPETVVFPSLGIIKNEYAFKDFSWNPPQS